MHGRPRKDHRGPRPQPAKASAAADRLVERLRTLPVRRDDEHWDVALMRLPMLVRSDDGGTPAPMMIALCVSSRGIAATSAPFTHEEFEPTCLLEAIASLAFDPLGPQEPALGYLPARVRMSPLPDEPTELAERSLRTLGVVVERTDDLAHFVRAAESISGMLQSVHEGPVHMPGIMSAKGMTVERVRGLAEAMSLFVKAAPWRTLSDEVPWTIHPRPATRALRVCIVTGALGEQIGLAFMASVADFDMLGVVASIGMAPPRPSGTVWSVMLERIDSVCEADVALWKDEALPSCELPSHARGGSGRGAPKERASRKDPGVQASGHDLAIPMPVGLSQGGRILRPSPVQLLLMETILRGFAACDAKTLQADEIRVDVQTSAGPQELVLRR